MTTIVPFDPTSDGVRPVQDDAQAFWLREPGLGEIRPVPLPEPGPDEVLVRTLRSGVSRGTETLVFRGGVPAEPVRRDAGAVPGGRLPGPGEVRLPQRRRRRARARRSCAGRTVFCLYPHQTAYVVPAGRGHRRARRRARRARGAGRHRRDRGQRAVGRRARWSATGSPSSAPGWSAAASPGCWPGFPGVEVTLVDVDPTRGRGRRRARRRLRAARPTPPAAATWSCTPARPPPGCSGRWTCSRRRAPCVELSWYGDAEVRLSLGGAFHSGRLGDPGQPGRHGRRRPAAAAGRTADRLALALDLLRDPAFDALLTGESRFDGAARGDGPARRRRACRRCATPSPTTEELSRVQRDRPRPHDGRPQPPRRGVRAGAAAARRDVRRRRDVPAARRSTTTASWSTSAAAAEVLHAVLGDADLPQPRRRAGVRRHEHHHRGAGPGGRRPARRRGCTRARSATPPATSPGSRSPCTSRTSRGRATSGRCERPCTSSCPTGIDDPARPSGGNVYDRRLCRGLGATGWAVHEHAVPGTGRGRTRRRSRRWPASLRRLPDGAVVLLDGLVASAAPEVLVPAGRPAAAGRAGAHAARLGRRTRAADAGPASARPLRAAAVVTTSGWTRRRLLELLRAARRPRRTSPSPASTAADLAARHGRPAASCSASRRSRRPRGTTCCSRRSATCGPAVALRLRRQRGRATRRSSTGSVARRCDGGLGRPGPLRRAAHRRRPRRGVRRRRPAGARRRGRRRYGMVVTEALARGLPVVATAVGGLPEALGTLPTDPAGAAGAAGRPGGARRGAPAWLTDDALRSRSRRAARERRAFALRLDDDHRPGGRRAGRGVAMTVEGIRVSQGWLAMREPADAAARALRPRGPGPATPPGGRPARRPRPRRRHRLDGSLARAPAAGTAALGGARPGRRPADRRRRDWCWPPAGTVIAVAAAVEQMSMNAGSVAAAMEQTSVNLAHVTAATEQMTSTIEGIAGNSERARRITGEATRQAERITEQMHRLGQSAREIGKVTETIPRSPARPTFWRSTPRLKRLEPDPPARALPSSPAKSSNWRTRRRPPRRISRRRLLPSSHRLRPRHFRN